MTTSSPLAWWAGDRQYWMAAIASCVGVLVAIGEGGFRPIDWSLLPLAALGFLAKAQRPSLDTMVFAVPALVVPLVINLAGDSVEFAMFLLVVAVVLLAKVEDRRWLANGYVVVAVVAIFIFGITGVYEWAWFNWISALGLCWAFGSAVRRYDRVLAELRAAQAELIDHATVLERRRIARDVHDLIGHSLSVVMLHIGGARRLLRTDPDEAEAALLQAEEAGRTSMADVRRTVGLMREEGETEATAPTPTLTDVADVVAQYRDAGLRIAYTATGALDHVDPPVAVAVHRIAQEALANVARHTVDAEVTVVLMVDDDSCRLTVGNRGGRPGPTGGDRASGRGHGLIGMRERALSAGGSLIAGPVDGGWSVDAVFPLRAGAAT